MDNKDYELRCRSCGATYLLSNAQLHSCGDQFVEPSKLTLNDGIPTKPIGKWISVAERNPTTAGEYRCRWPSAWRETVTLYWTGTQWESSKARAPATMFGKSFADAWFEMNAETQITDSAGAHHPVPVREAPETERQRYDRLRERMYTDRTTHAFHDASRALDTLIMSTPTSPKREHLTEANIHLQVAIEALNKAMKA